MVDKTEQRPSNFQDILDIPAKLDDSEAKEEHIVRVIIPSMDKRRERLSPMPKEDVARKLWSLPVSDKPGEGHELVQAMAKDVGGPFTVDEALEIADVVYYYLQPNTPEKASREGLEMFIFIILGDMSLALDFTIVKYETRLKYGDMADYREVEKEVMQTFFEIKDLPESLIHSN